MRAKDTNNFLVVEYKLTVEVTFHKVHYRTNQSVQCSIKSIAQSNINIHTTELVSDE